MTNPESNDSLNSAFVREMKAALKRHERAASQAQRREIQREMERIMRRYLGCGEVPLPHLDVALPAGVAVDRKLAAAGRDD